MQTIRVDTKPQFASFFVLDFKISHSVHLQILDDLQIRHDRVLAVGNEMNESNFQAILRARSNCLSKTSVDVLSILCIACCMFNCRSTLREERLSYMSSMRPGKEMVAHIITGGGVSVFVCF